MGPPGRIHNCPRGIPFGWNRVVPLAEEATSAPAPNVASPSCVGGGAGTGPTTALSTWELGSDMMLPPVSSRTYVMPISVTMPSI